MPVYLQKAKFAFSKDLSYRVLLSVIFEGKSEPCTHYNIYIIFYVAPLCIRNLSNEFHFKCRGGEFFLQHYLERKQSVKIYSDIFYITIFISNYCLKKNFFFVWSQAVAKCLKLSSIKYVLEIRKNANFKIFRTK